MIKANDMLTPFMIPHEFDVDHPTVIRGPFTNIVLERAQE